MVEIHPKLRSWVEQNLRKGYDPDMLRMKLVEKGQDPAIVSLVAAELQRKERFPDYVVQWLKYSRQQGDSLDYIREKLKRHGYSEPDINFLVSKHVAPEGKGKAHEHRKWAVAHWLVIALIVIVVAGIVILFFAGRRGSAEATTTTVPEATTTTLAGEKISIDLQNPQMATSLETNDEGILLELESILGYKSTLAAGRYTGVVRAKADKAPITHAYFSKILSKGFETPLLKLGRSAEVADYYYLDADTGPNYGWPHLLIASDDRLLAALEINSSSWKDFPFAFELQQPAEHIWVYFFDSWATRGANATITANRDIYINSMEFAQIQP